MIKIKLHRVHHSEQDMAATDATDESAAESTVATDKAENAIPTRLSRRSRSLRSARILGYGILPGLTLLLAVAASYLKWQDATVRDAQTAALESVNAAKDATVAMLSYRPDTAEKDLGAARERLTGQFRDAYSQLTHDVVIPGAKQKQISAGATVPAAGSVSADPSHAVVIVFVNQATTIGQEPPTDTASTVRVTMQKAAGRWLVSAFDPI